MLCFKREKKNQELVQNSSKEPVAECFSVYSTYDYAKKCNPQQPIQECQIKIEAEQNVVEQTRTDHKQTSDTLHDIMGWDIYNFILQTKKSVMHE